MLLFVLLACPTPKDETGTDSVSDSDTVPTGPSGAGIVEADCAPDDGSAVRFTIGLDGTGCDADASTVPHVRMTLWTGAPLSAGTYTLDSSTGVGWYLEESGGAEMSVSHGEITISSWGDTIVGSYEITVGGGETVSGTFEAPWCDSTVMCG